MVILHSRSLAVTKILFGENSDRTIVVRAGVEFVLLAVLDVDERAIYICHFPIFSFYQYLYTLHI